MLLSATDSLLVCPTRVVVAGSSGSGKTTMVRELAELLGLPRVELDALHHGPQWTPRESFAGEVDAFSAAPSWACEWQYAAARPVLAERADLMVWLDLPPVLVMRQVIARTLRRSWRGEVLWNGNREPPLRTILTDRDYIVRWAWRTRHDTTGRVLELCERRPELRIVRLRTRAEAKRWLTEVIEPLV